MSNAVLIALILAIAFLLCALPLITCYVYHRGFLRASPIPQLSNPFAKPEAATEAAPPVFACPKCSSPRTWKAKPGGWDCDKCHFYLRHTAGVLADGATRGAKL